MILLLQPRFKCCYLNVNSVLSIVYPVAITVVLLILIAKFIPTKRISQQIPVIIVIYIVDFQCY